MTALGVSSVDYTDTKNSKEEWFEFSPYSVQPTRGGKAIETRFFGGKTSEGKPVFDENNEAEVGDEAGQLMSIWGIRIINHSKNHNHYKNQFI